MKRLLTQTQLKHTKQAANRLLTCFIATVMAMALSLPAAGLPTLSYADEPDKGAITTFPVDLEAGNAAADNASGKADGASNSNNGAGDDGAANSNNAAGGTGSSDESDANSPAGGSSGGSSDGEAAFTEADLMPDPSTFNKYEYNGIGLDPAIQAERSANGSNDSLISPQSLPAGFDLAPYIVSSTDPGNTKVNLFNYSNGWGTAADDRYKSWEWGDVSIAQRFQNIFGNPNGNPNINKGRLLAFGDSQTIGMGYWNFGAGANRGLFAYQYPGMQFMTTGALSNGYPVLSDKGAASDPGITAGYNGNPAAYADAKQVGVSNAANEGNPVFPTTLGAKNVSRGIQYLVNNPNESESTLYQNAAWLVAPGNTNPKEQPALSEDQRSLQYLFDPDSSAEGKTSYENVTGLFQMDDEGYYYYNMRQNFAEFTHDPTTVDGQESAGHFTLYNSPAVIRTDASNDTVAAGQGRGGFFPFNTAQQVFSGEADGKLISDLSANADNNGLDHYAGMTVETSFRQPINGKVGTNSMTFEFAGDDDVWVYLDDALAIDLGGVHSELFGTIDFSTGMIYLGPSYASGGIPDDPEANATMKTTIRKMFEYSTGQIDDPYVRRDVTYVQNNTAQPNSPENFVLGDWQGELEMRTGRANVDALNGRSLGFMGETFASSTSHTLKMFYMERGNYDSSLALKFNLQPALYQQMKKVDQNGNALAGAEFDLYAVNVPAGTNAENAKDVTLDQVSVQGAPLTHLITDADGVARFTDPDTSRDGTEEPFNFSDRYDGGSEGLLYILRETKAPPGYKQVPTDLLLRFNPANTMLIVNNRYQSGSYASFNSYVTGNNGAVYYGQIGENGETVTKIPDDELVGVDSAHVPLDSQHYGLVVAVPMIKQTSYNSPRAWFPLYGDNLVGFQTVHVGDLNADYEQYRADTRTSTLTAALMQAAEHYRSDQGYDQNHTEGWYLDWDDEANRLDGTLQNLPGRADRYILTNPDGDMRMFYGVIEPAALARVLGVSEDDVRSMSTTERYAALGRVAMAAVDADNGEPGDRMRELVDAINPYPEMFQDRGYSALDISEFIRNFRTLLYVPNEQRQLRVTKIDQNGVAKNGAEFALYSSEADAKGDANRVASGTTATVDGADGMLIFEPRQSHDATTDGYADMAWPNVTYESGAQTYYLKETRAPAGCRINDTVIPIKVGVYSIYADAGTPDDNVSVSAGVGKLTQTMVQFASEGDVNITLRDITAFAQQQASSSFGLQDWEDVYLENTGSQKIPRSMNLHYGQNAVVDYGLSDADGGKNIQPFFVTDSGYLRTRVQQNLHAHDDPNDPDHSEANADDLGDMDITSLFSLINTVIVTDSNDMAPAAGDLSITKTVTGSTVSAEQYQRLFHFTLHIFDSAGNELPNSERFYFYGTDRTGYVGSGDEILLHHDENVVVQGIPEGYTYQIVETDADQDGLFVSPIGGTIKGEIKKDAVVEASYVNSQDKPKEPENPDNPDNPDDPNDPNDPNNPGKPGSPDSPGSPDGPGKDGDGSPLALMGDSIPFVLVIVAILAGVGALVAKRRAEVLRPRGKHGR